MQTNPVTITYEEYHATVDTTGDTLDATIYFKGGSRRWRVVLHRDLNDHQSRFHADRWDGTAWQTVHTVTNRSGLRIMRYRAVSGTDWTSDGRADACDLVRIAATVIGETI